MLFNGVKVCIINIGAKLDYKDKYFFLFFFFGLCGTLRICHLLRTGNVIIQGVIKNPSPR